MADEYDPNGKESAADYLNRIARHLPEADKFAICAHDGSILDFYRGQFSDVFVLLHPFIQPVSIAFEDFNPDSYPSDDQIATHCEGVSWAEVVQKTPLKSIDQIDVALRSRISGLGPQYTRDDWGEEINGFIEVEKVVEPSEGDFSPLVLPRVLNVLKDLGHEWLWVGDEFATSRKLIWTDDIDLDRIPGRGNLFSPSHDLLLTTHWDSHCTFLCSNRNQIDEILGRDSFEGFFCSSKTQVYWGVYPR